MKLFKFYFSVFLTIVFLTACSTAYKAKPLAIKTPAAYPNMIEAGGALIGADAFSDRKKAKEAFGFDARGAGMLPVQVVFDNQGSHELAINAAQTFLEDEQGNLWPLLSDKIAYERATQFSKTKQIVKEGAYHGFLGAAAGSLIGAAIGVVTGDDIAESAGKGAAVGAAAGATLGGVKGYGSDEARRSITNDLREKSLETKPIKSKNLAYGILFFPGEAVTAKKLRMQLIEKDTNETHVVFLNF